MGPIFVRKVFKNNPFFIFMLLLLLASFFNNKAISLKVGESRGKVSNIEPKSQQNRLLSTVYRQQSYFLQLKSLGF